MRFLRSTVFVSVSLLLAWQGTLNAGSFDCSVLYDEFDSLMNRQFLIEPGAYVEVLTDDIDRLDYLERQKGKLHLNIDRRGLAVAIFQTNRNSRGKMLFNWEEEPIDGKTPLRIRHVVIYGRVLDGYSPRGMQPTLMKAGMSLDLDSGNFKEAGESADLLYEEKEGVYQLIAVNGARLWFPVESMCHDPTRQPRSEKSLSDATARGEEDRRESATSESKDTGDARASTTGLDKNDAVRKALPPELSLPPLSKSPPVIEGAISPQDGRELPPELRLPPLSEDHSGDATAAPENVVPVEESGSSTIGVRRQGVGSKPTIPEELRVPIPDVIGELTTPVQTIDEE